MKMAWNSYYNFVLAVHEEDSQWYSGTLAPLALRWKVVKQFCYAGHTAQHKGGQWGNHKQLYHLLGQICL